MIDGKYLKELRVKNHYSAQDLSDLLHVSKATVYRWERENSLRDNDLINALATIYGMNAEQLYRESLSRETAVATEESECEELAFVEVTAEIEVKPVKKQLSLIKIGAITAASTFALFVIVTAIIILCVYFQPEIGDGATNKLAFSGGEIITLIGIQVISIFLITTATILAVYFIRKRRKKL